MKHFTIILLLSISFVVSRAMYCYDPYPVNQIPGPELVENGDFETYSLLPWYSSDDEGTLRVSSQDLLVGGGCGNLVAAIQTYYTRACNPRPNAGIFQQVTINQEVPTNITVSAKSNAVNVSGVADVDYSLYVDVTYTDGSHTYGLHANFPINNAGWNQQTIQISPKKPVSFLFVHLLFRKHTGTVFFDSVSVKQRPVILHPYNSNILINPSFDQTCSSFAPWVSVGQCIISTCGAGFKSSPGALYAAAGSPSTCFNEIQQVVYFNPPILNTVVFSVYVSVNGSAGIGNTGSLDIELFAAHDDNGATQDIQFSSIDYAPTNGFVKMTVSLTPTLPMTAAQASFYAQGPAGVIVWDNAKLIITN